MVDEWILYGATRIGTHRALDSKASVTQEAAVLHTVRSVFIWRVNVRVQCQSRCVSEWNVRVKYHGIYECQTLLFWRSANLFDVPLGKWPTYPQNYLLCIVVCCQWVQQLFFQPRQLWSPEQHCSLNRIIRQTVDLPGWRNLVSLPCKSLCKFWNNRPQHAPVQSACVSNPRWPCS